MKPLKFTNPIVFILGPTGCGKSDLAIEVAKSWGGEILNGDSLQVYQGLDIGTAKPSAQMFQQVPHHLFNIVNVATPFTAGDYRRQALKLISERISEVPLVLVGGSGFYIQALEHGMFESPEIASSAEDLLTEILKQEDGMESVYAAVLKRDPLYCQSVAANDTYRIQRAFLILNSQSKSISEIQDDFKQRSLENSLANHYHLIKLGLKPDRKILRGNLVKRTNQMLEQGLIEEVQTLMAQGHGETRPLQSVGYKETMRYLKNEITRDELLPEIVQNSMRLAKRQMTWFKRDASISWFDQPETSTESILAWLGTFKK